VDGPRAARPTICDNKIEDLRGLYILLAMSVFIRPYGCPPTDNGVYQTIEMISADRENILVARVANELMFIRFGIRNDDGTYNTISYERRLSDVLLTIGGRRTAGTERMDLHVSCYRYRIDDGNIVLDSLCKGSRAIYSYEEKDKPLNMVFDNIIALCPEFITRLEILSHGAV
jgi:hypothetical protein